MSGNAVANRPDRLRNSLIEDVNGTLQHGWNVLTRTISKEGIVDNTPTSLFSITTNNGGGANSGGSYSCFMRGWVAYASSKNTGNSAVLWLDAKFARTLLGTGATGVSSSVVQEYGDVAATTPATRSIASAAISTVETSEYVVEVQFTIDATDTGAMSTCQATIEVCLVWHAFNSVIPIITKM